jgi:hypothetical protein
VTQQGDESDRVFRRLVGHFDAEQATEILKTRDPAARSLVAASLRLTLHSVSPA